MKPFVINRNAWHYKLNKMTYHYGDDEWYMKNHWEASHTNFCAYWRTTIFKLIWITFGISLIGIFLTFFAAIAYMHPVEVFTSVGIVIAFFGLMIFLAYWATRISDKPKSESLFMQKYRAHKSKICPSVEFE